MKQFYVFCSLLFAGYAGQAQNVGIGTTTPTYPLTVAGNTTTGKAITAKTGTAELGFYNDGSLLYVQTWTAHDLNFATNNGSAKITIANANGFVGINTALPTAQMDINGTLRIRGNGAAAGAVLTSDANGNATWQAPSGGGSSVGFRGKLASDLDITSAAGEATVTGFTEEFDDGSGFNGATGTFTAPSAGVYQFTVNLNWAQDVSNTGSSLILTRLYLTRSGSSNIIEQVTNSLPNNNAYSQSQNFSSIYKLNAGDVVSIKVDPQVSTTFTLSGNGSTACRFAGVKLY